MHNDEMRALTHLRRWWMLCVLLSASILVGAAILLSHIWLANNVLRWTIITASVLLLMLGILWKNLQHNRDLETGKLRAHFGAGNWLSLARGMLIALLAGFLFSPLPVGVWAWLPAILYTLAAVSDYFDGFLARISHSVSELGEILDLEWDALGLLIAVSLSIGYGFLSVWFWLFGFARYLYIFTLWIHRKAGGKVLELPQSVARRPIAALTMGFMTVMLWPIISQPSTTLAAGIFAIPFTASFLRDWMVVTGRLDVNGANYKRLKSNLEPFLFDKIPVVLRILVLIAVLPELFRLGPSRQVLTQSFTLLNGELLDGFLWILLGIKWVSIIMISIGAAGRTAAFSLLIPLGLTIVGSQLTLSRAVGLAATLGIMIVGSGSWSLWKPEEKIFRRRAAEKG